MTPEEEIKALRTAIADLLDCPDLEVVSGGNLEPETLEAIERGNVLLCGPAPQWDAARPIKTVYLLRQASTGNVVAVFKDERKATGLALKMGNTVEPWTFYDEEET